jgi:DNA-directed RNA polymerase subunit RPC12/RpoP
MVIMKEFECKRCGRLVYLPSDNKKEPLCPICRGAMAETKKGKKASELKQYKCSGCGSVFCMEKGKPPYKCPFCNHTFPVTPRLKLEERL